MPRLVVTGGTSLSTPGLALADVKEIVESRQPHWYQEIVVPVLPASLSREPERLIVQTVNNGTKGRSGSGCRSVVKSRLQKGVSYRRVLCRMRTAPV